MNTDTTALSNTQSPLAGDNQSNIVPNPQSENASEDQQDKYFEWNEARVHLQRLISDWDQENTDTAVRRKERKVEIDVKSLQNTNQLDEDETIVPIRVIDTNISRELVPFINYLKNSRRTAIFDCISDPEQDPDLLEQAFTKVSTYTAWELPHHKCVDGTAHHGWDSIEVVYDEKKPGCFALEQIGHDKLFFPRSAIDIQYSPFVCRAYDVTVLQLKQWVIAFGFEQSEVDLILASDKNSQKEKETKRIYKCFFKKEGIVYCSWFALQYGVKDWLKKPVKHYVGIDDPQTQQPKDLEYYPIFINIYKLNEEAPIVAAKGRGFLDCYKQEALSALWSAYINGMNRASNIYASPAQEDGTGASLKELEDVKLSGGRILSRPVNFWHPDYPDPQVLKTLQFASVQNDEENNQVNFAAMNREDSRKTAKEIGAAQQQQQLLNSVQLTLFSTFLRQIYNFVWLIVQSQALQNKIVFLPIKKQVPKMNPMIPGQPLIDPQTQQPMMDNIIVNDIDTISKQYSLRAAGDVDVVAKDETIQKMRQDWPVISVTALKDVFLADYVKLAYPEHSDRYQAALAQGNQMDQMKGLISRLSMYLDGELKDNPEGLKQLPQQQQAAIAQDMQMAASLSGQQPNQQ